MADFKVELVTIGIEEHPNADALELAAVGGYRAIVKKGQHRDGATVAYIPESALLPEWLLKQENFWDAGKGKGMLAGSRGDRVKPIKLRGVLSEGLVIKPQMTDGDDPSRVVFARFKPEYIEDPEGFKAKISEDYDEECRIDHWEDSVIVTPDSDPSVLMNFFGIQKYEPPIPVHMAGEVMNKHGWSIHYDIENWKKFPEALEDGEEVVMTEKIHGTNVQIGYVPEKDWVIIASKGLGAKGLVFKLNERNESNLYVRIATGGEYSLVDKVKRMAEKLGQPVYLMGEIFGRGVQDLMYQQNEPTFRAFDMYVGRPQQGNYVNWDTFVQNCTLLKIPMVPLLYRGPFDKEVMIEHTNGKEAVSDGGSNIREGIVVKPPVERQDSTLGRVVLKSVSEAYLTRKGNTTELQ